MKRAQAGGDSKLLRWLSRMGIRPSRLHAEIVEVSRLQGLPPVSEKHFNRVYLGRSDITTEKVLTIVAAARSLSRLPVRPSDLFELEPDAGALAADTLAGHPDPARGGTARLSVFWRPRDRRMGSPATVSQDHAPPSAAEVLEALYREHGPLMVAFARVQWSLPEAEARAVVHDVFLSFFERQPQVENVRAFLLGATRNACKYYWRKRERETELPADLPDAVEDERQARWPLMTTLVVALAQMGERCRETLRSFYSGDEKPEQIARRLHVSPAYVYQILHGCREKLREMVSDPGRRVA